MALKKRFYDDICFDLSLHKGQTIDIRGGGSGNFFEKNILFSCRSQKIKMSSTNFKIKSLFLIQ